jgi:hypothetical protein
LITKTNAQRKLKTRNRHTEGEERGISRYDKKVWRWRRISKVENAIDTQKVTRYRSRKEGSRKDTQKNVWAQQKLKRQLTHRRKN